jgi:C4-dicarboxylate-specific signal transduction histidine kinase
VLQIRAQSQGVASKTCATHFKPWNKRKKKRILVEGKQEGEKVVVRFGDTGPGFNDLNRAFGPFYSTRRIGQGPGLRFEHVCGTVKEHNGRIYAQNLHPNGAAVTIELPTVEEVCEVQ